MGNRRAAASAFILVMIACGTESGDRGSGGSGGSAGGAGGSGGSAGGSGGSAGGSGGSAGGSGRSAGGAAGESGCHPQGSAVDCGGSACAPDQICVEQTTIPGAGSGPSTSLLCQAAAEIVCDCQSYTSCVVPGCNKSGYVQDGKVLCTSVDG
jgi:hypothetical protein